MRKMILCGLTVLALAFLSNAVAVTSPAERATNGIIGLLTDWGIKDYYVGAVKGVIVSVFPEANIVDISHGITPFDIREGAVTLLFAAKEFPSGTVLVGVVDPGVGRERRPIVLETKNNLYFVAPDNGLLTLVMQEFGVRNVYHITNRDLFRPGKISYSFHGRDIFSPVAAHLAAGVLVSQVGPLITDYISLNISPPRFEAVAGRIRGEALLVDQYGNILTNVPAEFFSKLGVGIGDDVVIRSPTKKLIGKFVYTYGDVPQENILAHEDSTGNIEIAINRGDAASALSVEIGTEIILDRK